ncbi:MAG: GNAT family N-acetyltransferase [Bacteroidota bacterium]
MPVTKATIADTAQLNLLVNSAYRGEQSKKGWTTEANLLAGNRIDEETIAEYLNTPGVTILKYTVENGNIKGSVYLEVKGDRLYLGMLSVSPEMQAGGIGRLLLHEAEIFAKSLNKAVIGITVISTRTELIEWYQRRGYVPTGEIQPFHAEEKFGIPHNPIQLIVMEKNING